MNGVGSAVAIGFRLSDEVRPWRHADRGLARGESTEDVLDHIGQDVVLRRVAFDIAGGAIGTAAEGAEIPNPPHVVEVGLFNRSRAGAGHGRRTGSKPAARSCATILALLLARLSSFGVRESADCCSGAGAVSKGRP